MGKRTKSGRLVKRVIIGLAVSALLIALDQYTKALAVLHLKNHKPFILWEGVFELRYLENRGAAFGIFQGGTVYFILLTIIALILIGYFYMKKVPEESKFRFIDMICILFYAGAVGNFIDRVANGYVVDFFYFCLIDFPIFNVADIYDVTAAAAMVILGLFYYKDEDYEKLFPSWKQEAG